MSWDSPAPSSAVAWHSAARARCTWTGRRCARVARRSRPREARRSRPSRASVPHRSVAASRRRGGASTARSAATARAARSCRPPACSRKRRGPPTTTSTRPWQATSAAAAPISAFARRSRPRREGPAMAAILENMSRRGFLIGGAAAAGGLVIGLRLLPRGFASNPPTALVMDAPRFNPTAFVSIDETGLVTIVAHRAEMGQGIRTALPMAVADELEADWSRVRIAQAVGDEATYGGQNTDGSRSLRHFLQPMREMGAAARQMLETAAANKWDVDVAQVRARNHQVIHTPTGRVLGYGELAAAARELPVPRQAELKLKRPENFRYIGKGMPIVDLADMTSGRAGYGMDARLPGMKYAGIARPPVYGGRVAPHDEASALAVPGGERVVKLDGMPPPSCVQPLGGVAVIARNTWAAIQGRGKLNITWNDGPNRSYDSP